MKIHAHDESKERVVTPEEDVEELPSEIVHRTQCNNDSTAKGSQSCDGHLI